MRGKLLESWTGAVYVAAAKTAFVCAVQKRLPDEARAELDAIDQFAGERAVAEWARRWNIGYPCVIEWASGDVFMRRSDGGRFRGDEGHPYKLVSLAWGATIADEWWDVMEKWNDTKLTAGGDDPRDFGKVRERHATTSPIAANPLAESRKSFLARAGVHWDARVKKAGKMGYKPARDPRKIEAHAEWLARNLLLGESAEQIAESLGRESGDSSAVFKALAHMKQLMSSETPD